MATCSHCGSDFDPAPRGRPRTYCDDLCKERARYARVGSRPRRPGYHKERYQKDREYQKARALAYYYKNQARILEQKRNHPGKTEEVEEALLLIRSGSATLEDAYEFMDNHLGFHSFEIESFIVDMLE